MQLLAAILMALFQTAVTIALTIAGLIVSAFYLLMGAVVLLCTGIYNHFSKSSDTEQQSNTNQE